MQRAALPHHAPKQAADHIRTAVAAEVAILIRSITQPLVIAIAGPVGEAAEAVDQLHHAPDQVMSTRATARMKKLTVAHVLRKDLAGFASKSYESNAAALDRRHFTL
jgi:hypothetical protein